MTAHEKKQYDRSFREYEKQIEEHKKIVIHQKCFRYCKRVDEGDWVVVEVSEKLLKPNKP